LNAIGPLSEVRAAAEPDRFCGCRPPPARPVANSAGRRDAGRESGLCRAL